LECGPGEAWYPARREVGVKLQQALVAVLALALTVLLGCPADNDDDTTTDDDDTAETGYAAECGDDDTDDIPWNLVPTDADNYSFTASWDIAEYPLAEAVDIVIDWSQLTQDMYGRTFDPTDGVETSQILVFQDQTIEQIEQMFSEDLLAAIDVGTFVFTDITGSTSVRLSDHTLFGTDVDIEEYFTEGRVWLWLLTIGDTPCTGYRIAAFLQPTSGSEETQLVLGDGATDISIDANLVDVMPVEVPTCVPLDVFQNMLTLDGQQQSFDPDDYVRLALGYYPDSSIEEVQSTIPDIESMADEYWLLDLEEGEERLVDGDFSTRGTPFEGVTSGDTWLLALDCADCSVPAPPFLTVLAGRD